MSESSGSPRLTRTIGPWQIMFYGLGSMLGAGVYALIGKTAAVLGNAMWLAFIVAMIAALLTGLSYASLGSRYPKAGGAAYITARATGLPLIGYVVGIAVMMSGITSMAAGLQAIALIFAGSGNEWLVKILSIALAAMIGGVIFRGIRESMWMNLACTFIEVAGLIFIISVGMQFWGTVDYWEIPATAKGAGIAGIAFPVILQGAVLAFFSFIGFEDILNVSEETKNPRVAVPFGLIGAMLAATVIYIGVAITAVSVVPWKTLGLSDTPLMDVAHKAAPWFQGIDSVFLVISVFAIGNTALLNYLMGSRLLYGMSRQKLLPHALGKIHPQRHTPHVSILALFIVVSILILAGGVKQLAQSTSLLLLAVFVVMNISLVILKFRASEERGGFEIPVLIPVLGAGVCLTLIVAQFISAFGDEKSAWVAPAIAAGIIVASAVAYRFTQSAINPNPEIDGPETDG